jgi:hypothetical protein
MNDETILDQDLTPRAYLAASEISKARERAIEAALDYYFKSSSWDEEALAALGCMTHHADGTEVFSMGLDNLVKFGAAVSKIDIDRNCALLSYTIEITELYK